MQPVVGQPTILRGSPEHCDIVRKRMALQLTGATVGCCAGFLIGRLLTTNDPRTILTSTLTGMFTGLGASVELCNQSYPYPRLNTDSVYDPSIGTTRPPNNAERWKINYHNTNLAASPEFWASRQLR